MIRFASKVRQVHEVCLAEQRADQDVEQRWGRQLLGGCSVPHIAGSLERLEMDDRQLIDRRPSLELGAFSLDWQGRMP